jgi:23S rRNA (cytidine2498-2'-O)-methyltransferase
LVGRANAKKATRRAMSVIYLPWPGFRESLIAEIMASGLKSEGRGYGLLTDSLLPLSFARQTLPDVQLLEGASIKEIAEALFMILPQDEEPWSFHSFSALERDKRLLGGERRSELVREALLSLLKKKRRAALRNLKPGAAVVLQHCLLSEDLSGISCFRISPSGEQLLSPFEGGRIEIPEDKTPPSRAYRKLKEALLTLGKEFEPGQSVVDLGAAPGSWSYLALRGGAKVFSVDRSHLAPEVLTHHRLSFVSGDAFSWRPDSAVDWLICDVICNPERTVRLLEEWLTNRLCKNFCVTMKFKGEPDFAAVSELRKILLNRSEFFFLRHLENNKNEITACGSCASR